MDALLPLVLSSLLAAQDPAPRGKLPALGEAAPPFALKTLEGKEVRLADFKGKRGLVLVFGSYT